jgi:flagella basal body P-ring formation protein FlgA
MEPRMVTYFRRTLLVWLWLCAAGIAGEINLRDAAQVDHAVVRLGDVAEIYGMDEQARERLLAVELLPSPASGKAKKLTVREVQDAIARSMPELASWTFAGSSETTVTRAAATEVRKPAATRKASLSPVAQERVQDRIEAAILEYVRTRLGDDAWDIEAELTEEQLSSLSSSPKVNVTGGRYLDAERVQFRVELGEEALKEIWKVTVRVTLPPMIVVARRELSRGELISKQDVELVRGEAEKGLLKPLESLEDVVGKETTRGIAAGQPITEPSLRPVMLVQRGQVVTVYSRCGGVQIRITGRAKENGAHGDLVPVESLTSRETFHARVSGPQEVEIYAGSTTTPTVDAAPREPSPWLAARRGTAEASAQANSKTRSTK